MCRCSGSGNVLLTTTIGNQDPEPAEVPRRIGGSLEGKFEQRPISRRSSSRTGIGGATSTESDDGRGEISPCEAGDGSEKVANHVDPATLGEQALRGSCSRNRKDSAEDDHTPRNLVNGKARDIEIDTGMEKDGTRRERPLEKKEDRACAAQMVQKDNVEHRTSEIESKAIHSSRQAKAIERRGVASQTSEEILRSDTASFREMQQGKQRGKPIEVSSRPRQATEPWLSDPPKEAAQDVPRKKKPEKERKAKRKQRIEIEIAEQDKSNSKTNER